MGGLDVGLFRAINRWSDGLDPWLTFFSVANSTLFFRIAILALVVGMVLRGGRPRRAALLALVAFPISDGLCNLAKHVFPVHRPYQILSDVVNRVGTASSMGTASSHAANMAAVATVMAFGLGLRWGAPWIVVALLTALSRVYVGAHFPSQVLLGLLIGVAVGWLVDAAARGVARRRGGEPEAPAPAEAAV